jgi:hypothetical protein
VSRAIVNVGTGHYHRGRERLRHEFRRHIVTGDNAILAWAEMPGDCPQHTEKPYAFKAYALHHAAKRFETLLWLDASVVPGPRQLDDLWEKIERDGCWIANNGFSNYEWTANDAYPLLFPGVATIEEARAVNRTIPHVVATAFGLSVAHPLGDAILAEYFRLASETAAFCGPWRNSLHPDAHYDNRRAVCGPADVRGHRHDQTALSVIAWRFGVTLSNCPEWFAYRGGETEKTCLIAEGL